MKREGAKENRERGIGRERKRERRECRERGRVRGWDRESVDQAD